jgi:hypothetical protein
LKAFIRNLPFFISFCILFGCAFFQSNTTVDASTIPTSSQQEVSTVVSSKIVCTLNRIEVSSHQVLNVVKPLPKKVFFDLGNALEAKEFLLNIAFTRYKIFSRSFLINYRKHDLIFPFHYFW